jgi:hypothetical protein
MRKFPISLFDEEPRIVVYLDGLYPIGDASQSASGEELRRRRTLMPSILDKVITNYNIWNQQ